VGKRRKRSQNHVYISRHNTFSQIYEVSRISNTVKYSIPCCYFSFRLLQEQQHHFNPAIMPTSIPAIALHKITFLTLPLEIRLAIYEYLPSGPLAVCRPVSTTLPHVQNIQPDHRIAILHTCQQIRAEAIPIFYRSVFIGSCERLLESNSPTLSAICNASVKMAYCDVPDTPFLFRTWLGFRNPFPYLKRCKLFVQKDLPFAHPSPEERIASLGKGLHCFAGGLSDKRRPLIGITLDLTFYLYWYTIRTDEPPTGCFRCTPMPYEEHHEVCNPFTKSRRIF
jgi:hypothetical protein